MSSLYKKITKRNYSILNLNLQPKLMQECLIKQYTLIHKPLENINIKSTIDRTVYVLNELKIRPFIINKNESCIYLEYACLHTLPLNLFPISWF